MNIMVYDVQADSGGAATILEYYYHIHKQDKANHYFYILSVYHLEETDNITVVNVPQVKKSWFHRLAFDYSGVRKYIRMFQIDQVLSLQNTIVPCFKGRQTVYEHNALPFSEYRFSFRENKKMWIYQNVIGRLMIRSIRKAQQVIVQTQWMKDTISRMVPGTEQKIAVSFPEVPIPAGYQYQCRCPVTFFYPANSAPFKNHQLILNACMVLKEKNMMDWTVAFTLNGDETEEIQKICDTAEASHLNFKWLGTIPREEVFAMYAESVLVFPSYIETLGLPIYEAMAVGCPVLAADCDYARDLASGYEDAVFFDIHDAGQLAGQMESVIMQCREIKC